MSTKETKTHSLGKAQTEIIEYLAENGPYTSNALASELVKDQAGVYRIIKKLRTRGLLTAADEKEYHGRTFDRYWLTVHGVRKAILLGVSSEKILSHASTLYDGETLNEIKNWCSLTMFKPNMLKALETTLNGRSFNLESLIEVAETNASLIPKYLDANPDVRDAVYSNPLYHKIITAFIESLGKKES